MTKEDIISMAREAGVRIAGPMDLVHPENVYSHELLRFAALVAAAERNKLAQPEPEPVSNQTLNCICGAVWEGEELVHLPPKRKPLTDEQISSLWDGHTVPVFGKIGINPIVFARAIEAAHGIKGEA